MKLSTYYAIFYEYMTTTTGDNVSSFYFSCRHDTLMHSGCVNYWARINGTYFLCGDNTKLRYIEKTNDSDTWSNLLLDGKKISSIKNNYSNELVSSKKSIPKEIPFHNEDEKPLQHIVSQVADSNMVSNYEIKESIFTCPIT